MSYVDSMIVSKIKQLLGIVGITPNLLKKIAK